MFGRSRIKELESRVEALDRELRLASEYKEAAYKGKQKAVEWAEQLKKDADKIAEERDKLKAIVREQTENDIAIAALKTIGVIPTEKKPEPGEITRLMDQRRHAAMMNTPTQCGPLGSESYAQYRASSMIGSLLGR